MRRLLSDLNFVIVNQVGSALHDGNDPMSDGEILQRAKEASNLHNASKEQVQACAEKLRNALRCMQKNPNRSMSPGVLDAIKDAVKNIEDKTREMNGADEHIEEERSAQINSAELDDLFASGFSFDQ